MLSPEEEEALLYERTPRPSRVFSLPGSSPVRPQMRWKDRPVEDPNFGTFLKEAAAAAATAREANRHHSPPRQMSVTRIAHAPRPSINPSPTPSHARFNSFNGAARGRHSGPSHARFNSFNGEARGGHSGSSPARFNSFNGEARGGHSGPSPARFNSFNGEARGGHSGSRARGGYGTRARGRWGQRGGRGQSGGIARGRCQLSIPRALRFSQACLHAVMTSRRKSLSSAEIEERSRVFHASRGTVPPRSLSLAPGVPYDSRKSLENDLKASQLLVAKTKSENEVLLQENDDLKERLGSVTGELSRAKACVAHQKTIIDRLRVRAKTDQAALEKAAKEVESAIARSNASGMRVSSQSYGCGSRDEKKRKLDSFVHSLESYVVQSRDGYFQWDMSATRKLFEDSFKRLFPSYVLTPSFTLIEDHELIIDLDLKWKQRQLLSRAMKSKGLNIFPSWHEIFDDHTNRVTESMALYYRQSVPLRLLSANPDVWEKTELVRVHSVRSSFERLVSVFEDNQVDDLCGGLFGGEFWVGIGLDKGGDTVKMTGTVINTCVANNPLYSIILGIYRGEESYDELRACLMPLLKECDELSMLTVSDGRNINTKVFLCVDGKVLTTLFGMGTGSSRYSCSRCTWDKGNASDDPFPLRDSGHFDSQHLVYLDALLDGNERRSKSAHWEALGIERECLCRLPTDRVFPASLHYLLGPGVKLIKKLEGYCITRDLNEHGFGYEVESMDEKSRNTVIDARKADIEQVRLALKDERRYEKDVEKLVSMMEGGSRIYSDNCSSVSCLIRDKSFNSEWENACILLTCQICHRHVHAVCTLLTLNDCEMEKESESFLCTSCNYESDSVIIARLKKRLDLARVERRRLENAEFIMIATLSKFESIVNGYGECFRALAQCLSSLGAKRSRYYQTYTGGQVQKVMKNIDDIYDRVGISKDGELYECIAAFRDLNRWFSPTFLTPNDLQCLETDINSFKTLYPRVVSTAFESSKFHDIISHVCAFATRWKTIGLFSEQATEHTHKLVTKMEMRFLNIPDLGDRLSRVVAEWELRAFLKYQSFAASLKVERNEEETEETEDEDEDEERIDSQ